MKESNKTKKLKIVVLGSKSVGKSSIIRRFVLDDFISDIQVPASISRPPLESIICPKLLKLGDKSFASSYGIQQASKNSDH